MKRALNSFILSSGSAVPNLFLRYKSIRVSEVFKRKDYILIGLKSFGIKWFALLTVCINTTITFIHFLVCTLVLRTSYRLVPMLKWSYPRRLKCYMFLRTVYASFVTSWYIRIIFQILDALINCNLDYLGSYFCRYWPWRNDNPSLSNLRKSWTI